MSAATRPTLTGRLGGWLARFEDGAIIRAAFFGLLTATAVLLYLDYKELSLADASAFVAPDQPILPAYDPQSPTPPPGPTVTTDPALLKQPLSVTLGSGGVLALTGTVDPGAADRFAAEVGAHAEYIKTVALDSPGGSVHDALAMGTLIRARGFATEVAAGALCASSCPLVLAGGIERRATPQSAIGVHQIYAALKPGGGNPLQAAGNAMSDAQKATAEISRYLDAMGIDREVWLQALETPPDRLYYFSPDELTALKVVTKITK